VQLVANVLLIKNLEKYKSFIYRTFEVNTSTIIREICGFRDVINR
jgi:hypothetical protein